jgi:hypothetical protein
MDMVKRMRSRWFGSKRKQNPFASDYVPSWEITVLRPGDEHHPTIKVHRELPHRQRLGQRAA